MQTTNESWPKRDPITMQLIGKLCWNGQHEHGQSHNVSEQSCECLCHWSEAVIKMALEKGTLYDHT